MRSCRVQFLLILIPSVLNCFFADGSPDVAKRVKRGFDLFAPRPIVTTTTGQIQGIQLSRSLFDPSYLAFKGIPYAKPPVGPLRWKNPVPHPGWTGVRDGSIFGNHCPNSGGYYIGNFSLSGVRDEGGSEDCLFLNVYTPSLSLTGSRAVMVFIHGGAFIGGSGDSWAYGPSYLVLEDIVLVTLNYRLGAFGFLATGDSAAQGNWGLKDQTEALRWVQKNIAKFGGDPNQVTIFGESAGSISVNYQIISDMRSNLFKRAISQSGAPLNPWVFQPNPLPVTKKLGFDLGLTWTSNQDLINKLRNVPFGDIMNVQQFILTVPRASSPFVYGPVQEPPTSPEPTFCSNNPERIYRSGNFTPLPLLIGSNSAESLFCVFEPLIDWSLFEQYQNNSSLFVPYAFNLNSTTQQAEMNEVAASFKQIYFNGTNPVNSLINQWVQFQSDSMFNYGIDRTVRYYSQKSNQPLYYYTFSVEGARNVQKHSLWLTLFPGAVHTDELFYLFDPEYFPYIIIDDAASTLARKRMVRMWTNFAKFGNPTPTVDGTIITATWPTYSIATQDYFDIGANLTPMRKRFGGRLQAWHDFMQRFNP